MVITWARDVCFGVGADNGLLRRVGGEVDSDSG
jgi:hypothetical protein